MKITAILTTLFLLPGFFSFLIVRTFIIGYGKEANSLEKTFYSLLFDIPIFLLSLWLLNSENITKFLIRNENYKGFTTLTEFTYFFSNEINMLIPLTLIIFINSLSVALAWMGVIKVSNFVFYKVRKGKITFYNTVWRMHFVKEKASIPVRVYRYEDEVLVTEGFLKDVSTSLDKDIEITVDDIELFNLCEKQGLINKIDFVYLNSDKNIKIIVYKQDAINDYIGGEQNVKRRKKPRGKKEATI